MIISYLSCDGMTRVEEQIVRVEFHQDIAPPHELFLRCTRPDGDIFEIYMLEHLYEITK